MPQGQQVHIRLHCDVVREDDSRRGVLQSVKALSALEGDMVAHAQSVEAGLLRLAHESFQANRILVQFIRESETDGQLRVSSRHPSRSET
jgi:hypothetical protein